MEAHHDESIPMTQKYFAMDFAFYSSMGMPQRDFIVSISVALAQLRPSQIDSSIPTGLPLLLRCAC